MPPIIQTQDGVDSSTQVMVSTLGSQFHTPSYYASETSPSSSHAHGHVEHG